VVDVAEIVEKLYGLPLEEFTRARDEAAKQLRGEGRREEAEQVKALRKPTAAAAAVNRLVREHRGEVEGFLQAAKALRDAQFGGKGDLDAATRDERDALERLVAAGGEAVRQSLLAAAVDEAAAGELLEGRLERELEPRGFGALLAGVTPRPAPKPARPKVAKPDDSAARARLREAKAALAAAESEARRAQREVEIARAAVETAERELERLHGRWS
jgi:hypothetical protein